MPNHSLVRSFASFVPRMIQKRILADGGPIESPMMRDFHSAILFADISGFTALTEKLAKQGPVGVETLARVLNEYFGQLIDIIHAFGGDVVKFAGDSMIAIWPAASSSAVSGLVLDTHRQAMLCAAACALEIRRKFLGYQAEESALYLKLALAAGHITQMHIGGVFNHWEFALTGNPLAELGVVNDLARAGDILVSPSSLELIQQDCEFESIPFAMDGEKVNAGRLKKLNVTASLPAGREVVDIPDALRAALSSYIPDSIINRIAAGQSEWLAEFRKITIVFINLFNLSQVESLDATQSLMQAIQRIIFRFEGSVNNIGEDDKGITVDAAFGLPPLAHEDDPVRAVRVAMMIRDELQKLDVRSSIGVTTGRVFCGLVGNDERREYTFLGNSVNLAARLMMLGAGQKEMIQRQNITVLCDRPTRDAAEGQVDFEALGQQKVKGRSEAVEVFRPLRIKAAVAREQMQLIGRKRERTVLTEALSEMQNGADLQTVVLQGEAGLGKSQLTADLVRQAQAANMTILVGEGDSIEKNNPYYAWRSVLNRVFGVEEILGKPQLTEKDRNSLRGVVLAKLDQIDSNLLRYAPLLTALLPVPIPENEFTSSLTGETRAGNTRELLVKILQHEAAESQMLLVMEDLHWLDSASWSLLLDVFQRIRPMMLALTSRPFGQFSPSEFKIITERSGTHFIELEAMALDDVEMLVCQRLGVESIPSVVGRLIREKSEGNPFFAEELAYALRDSGVLVVEDQKAYLAPGSENLEKIALPDTLQATITSRIDGLNPSQQLVLKVASVIGRIFAYRVLEAIHPIEADKPELRAYADTLTRLSLTLVETEIPDLTYIFKHAVTQDAAYNLMLFAQRRQLHQAVGEWIEEHHREDIETFYALLAHHWTQAARILDSENQDNATAKAREYLEKAGNQSLNNFANAEALSFFQGLLEFTDVSRMTKLDLGKLYRKMGDAYLGLGKLAEAKEYILKAMKTLGLPLPSTDLGLVGGVLKHVAVQTGHRLWPDRFRRRKFDSEEEEIRLESVVLTEKLAVVQFLNGDPNPLPMLFAVLAGLNIAETLTDTPELWAMYATMSAVAGFVPLPSQAKYYKERWFALGEEFEDPNLFIDGASALCTVASGNGEWQEVKDLVGKSSVLCEEMGDHRRGAEAVAYLAVNALMEGGPRLAEPYNKREWEIAMRRENPIHIAFAYQVDVSGMVWSGDYDDCIANADQCLALSEKSWVGEIPEYIVRSARWLALWLKGEREGVWDSVKAALDKISRASIVDFSAYLTDAHLAEIAFLALEEAREKNLPKTQLNEIEKYAKLAIKNLKKFVGVFSIGDPALNRFRGNLEWHHGRHEKAIQYWRIAAQKAHAFPMKYEEALAHLELGRHLEKDNAERMEILAKAAELFSECGLENWVLIVRTEGSR